MSLGSLNISVLVWIADGYRPGFKAEMTAQCQIIGVESSLGLAALELVGRGRTLVGLGKQRDSAQFPKRTL